MIGVDWEGQRRGRAADPLHAGRIGGRLIVMGGINEKETTDEVIQETRRIKEALAEAMGFDVDRILDDARQRQQRSGKEVLAPPARPDA